MSAVPTMAMRLSKNQGGYAPHQIQASEDIADRIERDGFSALAGAPRSGKTATAIRVCELLHFDSVLVFTPKAAIPGWHSEIERTGTQVNLTITNYEQAHKLNGEDYDFVILDESHRLGARGKPNKRFQNIRRVAWRHPLLIMSGTMVIESPLAIYHQQAISQHGPFRYKNFYEFWRRYGIPSTINVNGHTIEQYNKSKPELDERIDQIVVTMTQADAGIVGKAIDELHVVKLSPETKELIAQARDGVIEIDGEEILLESIIAERLAIHQIEYGGLKIGDDYWQTENDEVADYILEKFGDHNKLALMSHYVSTRQVFERKFKKARLLSSNAHAEGVDLSGYTDFVVAGTDFSGAKHAQRRERGINMMKRGDAVVHFIVTNGGISREVYKTVTDKKDFNLALYRRWRGGR
jgi:hypothetical protein